MMITNYDIKKASNTLVKSKIQEMPSYFRLYSTGYPDQIYQQKKVKTCIKYLGLKYLNSYIIIRYIIH